MTSISFADPTTMARSARPGGGAVPSSRLAHVPPNWFAAVMGTGVVAIACHGLMLRTTSVLAAVAEVFWLLTCVLFAVVVAATLAHWVRHPALARAHHRHAVTAHFYGAVPMAVLTVGTATMVAGMPVIGERWALRVGVVCWIAGSVLGLLSAITARRRPRAQAFGGWLMPVVPPMVAASAAAVLVGELGCDVVRRIVLGVGYAMFAVAVVAVAPVLAALWVRLRTNGFGESTMVPTWWIVLGPLGQSVTAVVLLGRSAGLVLDNRLAAVCHGFGVGFGLAVWVAAALWIVIVVRLTTRTARAGLAFTLSWWSFTFPLGTFVTGSVALADATGWQAFTGVAVVAFGVLVLAWATVAARSLHGVVGGGLCVPPTPVITYRPADVPDRRLLPADR
ncbi:TDT family transporter [Gordonia sp. ABSL1-1]|uniref:SLAC1 family transporter n=1 Tax=Gordonia sp. ABSL1-1 TaxID=3053923 RepID=UPI0025736F01|nr:TDT family transporter [Gordonia sp. ABSL1-1]MDL9936202.1 TDT family transporter [Gordonia sp. ABSL1-1]